MTAAAVLEMAGSSGPLRACLLFVAGFETAEVCSAMGVRNQQLKPIMDHALNAWRTDREFRTAYDQGVMMIEESKHT